MRWTQQQYKEHMAKNMEKRTSKMRNQKGEMDGIKFDSKKEMKRYNQLKIFQRAGEIKNLRTQKAYLLQENYRKNGKTIRKIEYKADFVYEKDGKIIIEDVKASEKFQCPIYKIKKKLFEYKYPDLSITEVYEV